VNQEIKFKKSLPTLPNNILYLFLAITLLVAFSSRLLFIQFHELNPLQSSIEEEYGKFAINVYKGYGYKFHPDLPETSYRMPLYVLFLVGLWNLFGFDLYDGLIAQCVFDTLTTLILFLLITLIFHEKMIGLFAAFLWAIYIPEWNYVVNLYTEMTVTLLLICHFLFFIKALKMDSRRYLALSGVFLGLTTLTRPESHLYIFLLWIPLMVAYRKDKVKVLSRYVLFLTIYFIVLSPWIVRNYRLTGRFIATVPMVGFIYIYNNIADEADADPYVKAIFKEGRDQNYFDMIIHKKYSEVELSGMFWSEEKKYIVNHFDKYFMNCVTRFLALLFNYNGWKDRPFTYKDIMFVSANFCFWLSVFITCFLYRPSSYVLLVPIWCYMLYQVGALSCLHGEPRYLLKIWPYLIMHFAFVIFILVSKIRTYIVPYDNKYLGNTLAL
jgi:hypothetical protein